MKSGPYIAPPLLRRSTQANCCKIFVFGMSVSLEKHQRKKETFINEKKELQERARDFAAGGDNWFERAKDFVTTLNRIHYVVVEGNLESQRESLEKIGSNFILK